jgi:hypothetical protein
VFQRRVMTIGSSFLCLLQGWPRAQQSDTSPSSYSSSPDYKELSRLRLLYPNVPILALSATCPPDVLRDLIATLRLTPPTDGRGTGSPWAVRIWLSINPSFSCGTAWYREVYKSPLSKESALQSRFETVELSAGRKGHGKVHPGKPPG